MKTARALPQFVRDLLSAPPRTGEGVHPWLFRLASVLHPYRDESEIMALLSASVATCGRTVPEREIRDAVINSKAGAWKPGTTSPMVRPPSSPPSWPAVNQEQREAVLGEGLGLVDLWEASPVRIQGGEGITEGVIDALFPGNPLLCCGASSREFQTAPREEWRGRLADLQLIVPSPMSAPTGRTKDGERISAHTLANTGARRFLIVEFDAGTADEHAAVLLHLGARAPLALAVHSGGKSLHGWFYCAGQPEETLLRFMRRAVSLGADRATWTRSQFVRMPGGLRDNGQRQTVYFFAPGVVQ